MVSLHVQSFLECVYMTAAVKILNNMLSSFKNRNVFSGIDLHFFDQAILVQTCFVSSCQYIVFQKGMLLISLLVPEVQALKRERNHKIFFT
jgi:hypothetical protein